MNSSLATLALIIAITLASIELAARIKTRAEIQRHKEKARERFEARPRGRVVKIGTIVRDRTGRELPAGFALDCEHRVPSGALMYDGENVRMLMAGYTAEELVEIARNPKEWQA